MAQRFGAKHSPDGRDTPSKAGSDAPIKNPFDGQRPSRAAGRVNFLFLAPLPLLASAFFRDPTGLAITMLAFGFLILAAWLTREGIRAQEAYEARKIARRPAIPRKIFGAILTGTGLFFAGYISGNILNSCIFAGLGTTLHLFSFGLDPMKNKGLEGIDTFQTDRVARAVGAAEDHLAAMQDAIQRAGDRHLETRIDTFQATARDMFRSIENDPRDLTAARKFLSVYLQGARNATARFADLYARNRDAGARAEYVALLDDLEANFSAQTQRLLQDDRSDLNIEIEVLRERLAREGVPLNDQT